MLIVSIFKIKSNQVITKMDSEEITLTLILLDGQVHIIQVPNSARMHDVAYTLRKLCTDKSDTFIRFYRAGNETQLSLNKLLVELGIANGDTLDARITIHNPSLDNPLHKAIRNGNISQVRDLLDKGADVNAVNFIQWTSDEDLLDNGADVDADVDVVNIIKWTPLHYASIIGDKAIATLLLDKGADVHAVNIIEQTPLHLACLHGYDAVVQLLLDNGADMNVVDHFQLTPIQCARTRGHGAVVDLLVAHDIREVIKRIQMLIQ